MNAVTPTVSTIKQKVNTSIDEALATMPAPVSSAGATLSAIKQRVYANIDEVLAKIPAPQALTAEARRGVIARYTAVLEGNFIYWMTATYLCLQSAEARPIILDNLMEEIRDCHPTMLRRFALAAEALPTDRDALAIHEDLTNVRFFVGQLSSVQTLVMMAFFEGWIQKFMAPLGALAAAQGSSEMEYITVHGVCDIEHTQGLFLALSAEMALNQPTEDTDLFVGLDLLRSLVEKVLHSQN